MKRVLATAALMIGCTKSTTLTVEMPLHLEDHVAAATVVGSEVPPNAAPAVEWRFDEPQPEWKATLQWPRTIRPATLEQTGEALRVTLTGHVRNPAGEPVVVAGIHVDLPEGDRKDWADVVIRARVDSASPVAGMGLRFNLREGAPTTTEFQSPFQFPGGQNTPIVADGSIQTYRLRVGRGAPNFSGPWRQLGLWFWTRDGKPGSIDLLSVTVEPAGREYAQTAHGVRAVRSGNRSRRALFTHAPGTISWRIRVPEGGRFDVALGVQTKKAPVSFTVTATSGAGATDTLLNEQYSSDTTWAQRSVDLAAYAGRTVTLALQASSGEPGTVAFWGAPTVSGAHTSTRPNVILYIIDGGGADMMSLYGYNRRTTPNLERIAAEGVVFEHAYSTALWTGPSTATFLTSLHNSVLGNTEPGGSTAADAPMMAERFHDANYQTAVFTSNPNAGHPRGVDVFRDAGIDPPTGSTVELHNEFWQWRATAPGEPYLVHFQTTDVHRPHVPLAPYAGLFAPTDGRAQMVRFDSVITQWERRNQARFRTEPLLWGERFKETGIDRKTYYNLYRALFDESMAHQDYQLGRFVEELKRSGAWENTLLVIAADHSVNRGSVDFILPLLDSMPPEWSTEWATNGPFQNPIFRSTNSHVPLIFIWPGRIKGGRRLREPVSMIDLLPTLLDLAGLPALDVQQGQSLAPLLLGRKGWHPRPVILEEIRTNRGRPRGMIEMVDGRWGASLWIGEPEDSSFHRPTPLVLYDVWNDPQALMVVNDRYPELVKKYTALLENQWEAHQLLARRFAPGGKVELTPEQLQTLRALGYIR